jgi:hypothetical protein
MPQDEKVTVALPENLQRQFAHLQKRLFRLETTFAFCAVISAVALAFLLIFVSDRFWDTPRWLRGIFLAAPVAVAVAAALWWSRLWVFKKRDWRTLAVIVERKYSRLGDRLLGIVELAEESKRPAYFSPELYRAAIQQVAEESEKYDFVKAANERPARRQAASAVSLLALAGVAALILPLAAWNSLKRWVAPLAKIPRFTLVEFAGVINEQIVPHGEKMTLTGQVKYRSFWRPARVKLRLASGRTLVARARDGDFEVEIPAQFQDSVVQLRAGDAAHSVNLAVRHRPAIEQASAEITLPDYLGYPLQEENAESGMIEVLEGSLISLRAKTSRDLQLASFQLGEQAPRGVTISSNRLSTPAFSADAAGQVALRWRDSLGLTNTTPWRLALQTKKDGPPLPEVEEMYPDTAILETEVLPISFRAQDDFGVKTVGLNWSVSANDRETNSAAGKDYAFETKTNALKYLEHTYNLSPAVLGVPAESTIEIRAFAVDYLPGRPRSESPIYRIHVLGNAQHAEMVRQNLESLLVQLEEVTRLEERIASETKDIKDLQKLDTPEAAKKIADLEQLQEQNAAQLQDLAREGMKNLREALRNPTFNEEVLTEWTRNLHQMQKLSQEQMKEAAQSLRAASESQESREENLAEAQKKEEETLAGLQKMQEQVNQSLDELQALTLAQRLRQLGGQEKKIETALQTNIPDTIGLMTNELSPRYLRANSHLASAQTETHADSTKLEAEISRFYERTQKPNYGDVTKQMAQSNADVELERLRDLIQENIGMEAMQNLALWASRFEEWAALLEPKPDSSDGGGAGQGGGEKDDAALKQLLSLLRFRERQVNIQGRTQLLHEYIQERTAYRDGAVLLAASQGKLNRDLNGEAARNAYEMLESAYNDAVETMSDVESLLDRPRTDEVTRSAQDKSLAHLTDLINLLNEEAKKQQSSSSSQSQGQGENPSSEQMAFLMQMMSPQAAPGMQGGQQPGANMSGGGTDRSLQTGDVDGTGKAADGRSVRKSTGVPQNYPTEFREALERYFKALEQMREK